MDLVGSRRQFLAVSVAAAATAASTASTATATAATGTAVAKPGDGDEEAPGRVVLLGVLGGPPPEATAYGIATALVVDDRVYVIDAGRGAVSQYVRAGLKLADLQALFVTHLHADHVCDLHNFFLLGGFGPNDEDDAIRRRVALYGPGSAGALPPAGDAPVIAPDNPQPGLEDLMRLSVEAFAYQTNLFMRYSRIPDPRTLMHVRELTIPDVGAQALSNPAPRMEPFPVMDDGTVRVSAVLVPHGPVFPAFAYRFDTPYGSVVMSGDTALSRNVERLAQGADVLVHEAIDLDAQAADGAPPALLQHLKESHTSVDDLGPLAERAGVRTLVLSHLMPSRVPSATWKRRAARGFSGRVIVGSDLKTVPLPGRRGTDRSHARGTDRSHAR